MRLSQACPEISYVLGRVTIPGFGTIDHDWSHDELGYFDITLGSRVDAAQMSYQKYYKLDSHELARLTWMDIPPTIYEIFMTLHPDRNPIAGNLEKLTSRGVW